MSGILFPMFVGAAVAAGVAAFCETVRRACRGEDEKLAARRK